MYDVLGVRLPHDANEKVQSQAKRLGMTRSMFGRVAISAILSDLDEAGGDPRAVGELLQRAAARPDQD